MRTLKFRAWDTKKKTFPMVGFDIMGECTVFDLVKQYRLEEHNDLIIQQFIGMKDANDTDIYEGDILQGFGWYFEIKYGNIVRTLLSPDGTPSQVEIPCFYFQRIGTDHKLFPIVHNDFGQHDLETLKIVGNIFENPNLVL